jgi:hypothetical protein
MGYVKFIDGLPRIVKILIVDLRRCFGFRSTASSKMRRKVTSLQIILDIFLGFIAWIMDIIDIIFKNRFFSWGDWIHF